VTIAFQDGFDMQILSLSFFFLIFTAKDEFGAESDAVVSMKAVANLPAEKVEIVLRRYFNQLYASLSYTHTHVHIAA
jgi:hypothetical protein